MPRECPQKGGKAFILYTAYVWTVNLCALWVHECIFKYFLVPISGASAAAIEAASAQG